MEIGQEVTEEYVRIPGYRPDKREASITLAKGIAENQIIFWYSKIAEVEYQVIHQYVDADGKLIEIKEDPVTVLKERVVEYPGHEDIPGNYFPTKVVESLMLTSNPELNKIYFYYDPYPVATYVVHHYYQTDLDQAEYAKYPENKDVKETSDPVRKGYSYIAKRKITEGYKIEKVFVEEESQTTSRNLYLTPDADQMGKVIHVHMYYSLIPATVTVTKAWVDDNNAAAVRPDEILVQLTADGVDYGELVTLNADNEWTYIWQNLLGYKDAGQETAKVIDYSVKEIVPAGYKLASTEVTGDVTEGYQVTLTNKPMETAKTAKVQSWDDRTYDITISASAPAGTDPFTDVTIKDYIDSRFVVVEDSVLAAGGTTVEEADGNVYVIWENQTVNPADGTTPGWSRTITVKAKEEYIGGNDVTTNGECTITVDGKTFYLDSPTVNVKVDFNLGKEEHWIYKGNTVGAELFSDAVIEQITKGDLTTYTNISDVVISDISDVKWYEDEECTKETTVEAIRQTGTDAVYYAQVIVTPKADGEASLENTTDTNGAHKVEPISKVGTYTVHMVKGELQIDKKLEYVSSEDQTFTFIVTKGGSPFQEVTVTVPAGSIESETVKLSDLEEGIYVVTEASTEDFQLKSVEVDATNTNCYNVSDNTSATFHMGYDENNEPVIVDGKLKAGAHKTETDAETGTELITVTKGVLGAVAYTNMETHTWQIVKVGADIQGSGSQSYLTGAKFKLELQGNFEQNVTYYGKTEDNDATENMEDGLIKWYSDNTYDENSRVDRIPNGEYTLTEIEAPAGYRRSNETWALIIKNGKVTPTSSDGTQIAYSETIGNQTVVTYYFNNVLLYSLPSAGGEGIYWYSIGGMLLMMAAALIWHKNKYKEVLSKR